MNDGCFDGRMGEGCDIEAYGYVYLSSAAAVTLAAGSDVPFNNNGPLDCVIHAPNTPQIFFGRSGVYKVFYAVFGTFTAEAPASIALAVNGAIDPSTIISLTVSAGGASGSALLRLRRCDFLTLRNSSTAAVGLAVAPAVGAQLTLFRLDDIDDFG